MANMVQADKKIKHYCARMVCWFCGTQMIWGADFSYEDYCLEGDGIVATFHCPNDKCNAEGEMRLPV